MINSIISSFFVPAVMVAKLASDDAALVEAMAFWSDPCLGRLSNIALNADGTVSVLYTGEALADAETMSRKDAAEIFGVSLL